MLIIVTIKDFIKSSFSRLIASQSGRRVFEVNNIESKRPLRDIANVPDQLNSHIEAQMTKLDSGRWQCLTCGWETHARARLWEHVEATHVVTSGYSCELCHKICPSKNAYKTHKSRYHKPQ